MKKCCGKPPSVREYRKSSTETVYWVECPNCRRRTSYGYNAAYEAKKAWDDGVVSKPQFKL